MKEILQEALKDAFRKLPGEGKTSLPHGVDPSFDVTFPKDDSHGDYTSNAAFLLARRMKSSPMSIATLLCEHLELPDGVTASVSLPGYINFTLASSCYEGMIASFMCGEFSVRAARLEKIMVEYSQPNTLKEFHIGHFRNVCVGSAIVNVLRFVGHEVLAANYVGDTGTHIGKCLWGLLKFHADEDFDKRQNKSEFLGKVYTEAAQAIERNSEYEEEAKALQRKLEGGDSQLVALWKKTRDWSLEDFNEIYRELGISFDVWFFESEEEIAGKKMLPELLEKGVLEKSDGTVIANLEKEGLRVLVLVRKDGSALYGLKDIPLAKKKFEVYGIDRSVYVVDVRQSLYFQQIFAILRRMGFERPMTHVGYEFVSLKGGESMSSRKGNIIVAKDVIRATVDRVRAQFPLSPDPMAIALGALRFSMLRHSVGSGILFDIEESVQLHGATGPYVQYAHARMASIQEKAKGMNIQESTRDISLLNHPKERSLFIILAKFSEVVLETSSDYGIHRLAHYALELADAFHSLYDACIVLDKENRTLSSARLALVGATKNVLSETLRLIGVSAPEKM
ncbi:MAG: arginine--tRNA ligase [Candidatus Moraniibacteriota bacterium]